ncbi:hypothetical protein B0H13DRAFT_1887362 [Mycena leptocephala]|nr:hypothetical protein B0H13DRAFT_1887362 [Mycena leptocephala]
MSKNEVSYTLSTGLKDPVVKLQPQLVHKMKKMRRVAKYIQEAPRADSKGRCPVVCQNNAIEQMRLPWMHPRETNKGAGFEIPVKPTEVLDTILYQLLNGEDVSLGVIQPQRVHDKYGLDRANFLAATRRRVAAIQTNPMSDLSCTLILFVAFNLWMMATANQSNDPSVLAESGRPDRGTMKWISGTCLTRWRVEWRGVEWSDVLMWRLTHGNNVRSFATLLYRARGAESSGPPESGVVDGLPDPGGLIRSPDKIWPVEVTARIRTVHPLRSQQAYGGFDNIHHLETQEKNTPSEIFSTVDVIGK